VIVPLTFSFFCVFFLYIKSFVFHTMQHTFLLLEVQHVAARCSTLQHVAARCSALQRVAVWCIALQRIVFLLCIRLIVEEDYIETVVTLQHTATHCNTSKVLSPGV